MEPFALNTIYIVRHGEAEDGFGRPDAERQLTEKGKEKLHEIGKKLHKLHVSPDLIVCSPFARAVQTATIIAEELGYKAELLKDPRIIPMGRYEEFCDLFFELTQHRTIMFVGHEPSASEFVAAICGSKNFKMDFRKGAVACIAVERLRPVQGSLLWYAPSKILRA
jgi:phosphohistidine phosphatase